MQKDTMACKYFISRPFLFFGMCRILQKCA